MRRFWLAPASLLIGALLVTFPSTAWGDAGIKNLVVINADATIIQPGEPFDLQGATVVFTPKPGGGYSVSTIPASFDARVGSPTGIASGGSVQASLGFVFTFFNRTWTSLFVNANGTLTFSAPDGGPHFNAGGSGTSLGATVRTVLDAIGVVPRIAAMWQSWDPVAGGGVLTNPLTDRFIVTWNAAPLPNTGIVATFQVVLFGSGTIHMTYPAVPGTPPGGYLTGISPGSSGGSRVTTVDFSIGGGGSISAFPNFEPLVQVFGSSVAPLVNMNAVARKFFALQADLFDQLVVFSTFPQTVLGGGFNQRMRRTAAGTGLSAFDVSSFAGSRGRLHGLINLRQLSLWPDDPFGPPGALITLIKSLAHETGHSWLSYVKFDDGGVCSDLLLDEPGAHWSFFHNDDASFMGGHTWNDNADGSFTTIDAWARYGQLDLYLMGLLAPPDVVPVFFLRDPSTVNCTLSSAGTGPRSCVSKIGVSVTGSRQNTTLSQILTCAGSRSPATGFSEVNPTASWSEAFILLIPPGVGPSTSDLSKLDTFRTAFESYFFEVTGGRGSMTTSIPFTHVSLNATDFRPGDTMTVGFEAQNPTSSIAADLYLGVLTPDGHTVVVFTGAGGISAVGSIDSLGALLPSQSAPRGFSFNQPVFFQFTFPAGLPEGPYLIFAVLLGHGALADNIVGPGDILAVDIKPFFYSP